MKKIILAAVMAAFTIPLAGMVSAQETPHAGYRETGSQRAWVGIYSPPDRGTGQSTSSCAIYSRPKTASVFKDDIKVETMRGELAAFISWNGAKVDNKGGEVSFMVGVPVREGRNEIHALTIDGDTRFDLVGVGDRLYVMPEDDGAVITAIRKGGEDGGDGTGYRGSYHQGCLFTDGCPGHDGDSKRTVSLRYFCAI